MHEAGDASENGRRARLGWAEEATRLVAAVVVVYLFKSELTGWPLAVVLLGLIFSNGVSALLQSLAAMVRVRIDALGAHIEMEREILAGSQATEEFEADVQRRLTQDTSSEGLSAGVGE